MLLETYNALSDEEKQELHSIGERFVSAYYESANGGLFFHDYEVREQKWRLRHYR
jgi:hypothetical protein